MKFKIPTLNAVNEAYARATARSEELSGKLAAAEAESAAIEAQIISRGAVQRTSRIQLAAEALVEGRDAVSEPPVSDLRAKLTEARNRAAILQVARDMQSGIVIELRGKASSEVCSSAVIQSQVRALNAKFASALAELAAVADESRQFGYALEAEGLSWSGRVHLPSIISTFDVRDGQGEIARFFRNAIAAGVLDVSAIPGWLREAWGGTFKTPADLAREAREQRIAQATPRARDTTGWHETD